MSNSYFSPEIWRPALDTFGAVTHLTVLLYRSNGEIAYGPAPSSPLFTMFDESGYDPGIFADCAQLCLAQSATRPALVIAPSYRLAVVGASLVLEGDIVGAAVAGYALADFAEPSAIEGLARKAGVPFRQLWEVARQQSPVPERRLILYGELLQVLGDTVLREIHRTRQYQETADQLASASAAKDEFLAVLSHELRTPLTPILAWTDLLKNADNPALVARGVEVIERNARLQVRLVDDLLELNRAARGKVVLDLRAHQLSKLLGLAVEAATNIANQKGVVVRTAGGDNQSLWIDADEHRIQQIFRNILDNAVKFTPSGGTVTVTLTQAGDWGVVEVRDTGDGIAAEFLPHVFELFRQQDEGSRRRHPGLGIGLALVRRLTELHGGLAAVISEGLNKGTTVTLQFPLVKAPAQSHRGEPDPDVHQLDGVGILVVEDQDDAREATVETLKRMGATVEGVNGGPDALLRANQAAYDVVLCDLDMPGMDGFEFLRALKRQRGAACPPVIAISGLASSADHKRTQAAGFDSHIDKPFDHATLITAIRASLKPLTSREVGSRRQRYRAV